MADAVEGQVKQFIALVDGGKVDEAQKLLSQLKIALTGFPALGPGGAAASPNAKKELTLARTVFEYASILGVKAHDLAAFERHIAQLKIFYTDYSSLLEEPKLRLPILAMRLLHFLIENRMAEFHSELETLTDKDRQNECIAFTVRLEQNLMEGSYLKVLESRRKVPFELFQYFMDALLDTVRDAFADCAEIAYQSISISEAQKLLFFDSQPDFVKFVKETRPEWTVKGDRIWFKSAEHKPTSHDIPAMKLITDTLAYATELDRIV